MSSKQQSDPTLWIVAGPNGSGKSTVYSMLAADEPAGSVWIINPDALTLRIASQEQKLVRQANLEAVQRIEVWLRASIATHKTIGVETVLSTSKYRSVVELARGFGFKIRLLFVFLENVDMNVARVQSRVRKGGHSVPENKIRERHKKSFVQLAWFLRAADRAEIYDNSGSEPRLVLTKVNDEAVAEDGLIPELEAALMSAFAA